LKYLIVGFGSIGKRHVNNIRIIDPGAEISLWHTRSHIAAHPAGVACEVFCYDDAISQKPDIAIITNPASDHIPIAQKLSQKGIDLFIEKPLSSSMDGVNELLQIQKISGNLIMVGYNFRFHPAFILLKQCIAQGKIGKLVSIRAEVGQYLPDWRPGTDYRLSVSAQKSLGGGAVLELSHEIDYTRWLAGEITSVMSMTDHVSDLDIDVEDSAEIILKFSSCALGSIHLDMIQRFPARSCKMIGTLGTAIWDGTSDSVMLYTTETNQWNQIYSIEKTNRNRMYLAEMEHFISCCRSRKEPAVTVSDGKRVLEIALAALESSRDKRCITV
jgi:predicted dehydrogenase